MSIPDITLETARNLTLKAQGFTRLPEKAADKESIVQTIRRLNFLQIDTINIVARAPYFSLFSRIGDFDPGWLDESLAEKRIFEYWAHEASFLPIEDYPYHRRLMLERLRHPRYYHWYERNKGECDRLLTYVRENGPVRSADFERQDGRKGSWWDWKFEKDALEFWFCAGELMIARREKFQRVYDLRECVLPEWRDADAPPLEDTLRYLVMKSVGALGVCKREWVNDYFRLPKGKVIEILDGLLQEGELIQVNVEGWPEPALLRAADEQLITGKNESDTANLTTLLSPFDSLICDRKRTKQLFDFDFSLECYLPPAKRKYGYFLLPILYHGQLVGRLDAKAHRKEGIFEVKGLFWEQNGKNDETLKTEVYSAIQRCADWHCTPEVRFP
jgi:uncharacterized protein YcaQ